MIDNDIVMRKLMIQCGVVANRAEETRMFSGLQLFLYIPRPYPSKDNLIYF